MSNWIIIFSGFILDEMINYLLGFNTLFTIVSLYITYYKDKKNFNKYLYITSIIYGAVMLNNISLGIISFFLLKYIIIYINKFFNRWFLKLLLVLLVYNLILYLIFIIINNFVFTYNLSKNIYSFIISLIYGIILIISNNKKVLKRH